MTAQSPWGLTRLSPFAKVSTVPPHTMKLDPETQTGLCVMEDGSVINFGHRKTNTGTETKTQNSKGDGGDHKQYDPDSDQDTDQD